MEAKDYQQLASMLLGALLVVLGSIFFVDGELEPTIEPDTLGNSNVERVIDGDTVDVEVDGETVRARLIGIDTPESVDPRKEVECFGLEASQHLKNLLDDETVRVEYDDSQGRADKYGRALVYLRLDDGTNVAEKMLRDGFAYEYTYSKPYEYQELFKNAEQDARDNERGLWSSETCGGNR